MGHKGSADGGEGEAMYCGTQCAMGSADWGEAMHCGVQVLLLWLWVEDGTNSTLHAIPGVFM